MALQLGALRDALLDAKVSPEKAAAAAEELAGFEHRFAASDSRLTGIDSRLTMLTWAVGILAAVTLGVLASHAALWMEVGKLNGSVAQQNAKLDQIARAVESR